MLLTFYNLAVSAFLLSIIVPLYSRFRPTLLKQLTQMRNNYYQNFEIERMDWILDSTKTRAPADPATQERPAGPQSSNVLR